MQTTWLEWKHKASLLSNQWRRFRDMQPKAATNQTFSSHPPPAIILTAATSSPSSRPSTPAASSVPQPMDLGHTHLVKIDPHHGLCFNCANPDHITNTCHVPFPSNIHNIATTSIPR